MEQTTTEENYGLYKRVLDFERACHVTDESRRAGRKVVFTSGTFDILHVAHFYYLAYLKMKGDLLIVGIEDNETAKSRKGSDHPFFDESDRALMIANIKPVDYVYITNGRWNCDDLIKLKPDFVGVPPFDPEMDDKIAKIRLLNGTELIVTPPFLREYSSSTTQKQI